MKKEFFHIPGLFLSYFLIKKEKKDSLLACYLFFCLSLRHYYFRYLRSNSYLHTLVISTLYHYSVLQSNSLRKINSFY